MEFNFLLEKYRQRAGLSKINAANLIGISDSYYSRLEKGIKKGLTLENLEKIKEIYNLTDQEYEELVVSKFMPEDKKLKEIIFNYFKSN
ncbi:helix-turn-helix domain-containing protein [Cetobacterium sp.]|uniref:helix-turn-helix domain-containing protein n=1 Tax=Cetobacterium sp. TaxID=2071632 RepID=UPI003F2E9829